MLELYHHGSSVCAAKVRFALGEKRLEWQGHYLDILKGDQFAPEYQKLNPKAVVPTLVHDGQVIVDLGTAGVDNALEVLVDLLAALGRHEQQADAAQQVGYCQHPVWRIRLHEP